MDLFEFEKPPGDKGVLAPLAERARPRTLAGFVGQTHLVGPGRVLRKMIEEDQISSMIFWGPPGVGKTTLACIIASETRATFFAISAVASGLADVRKIMDLARKNRKALGKRTVLFIDEIHRFNKAQQDALLHAVEDGTLILIGATTENPSFEVISPLLSRCRVYRLEPLTDGEIRSIMEAAMSGDESLSKMNLEISNETLEALVRFSAGDARHALNALELAGQIIPVTDGKRILSTKTIEEAVQRQFLRYDKTGDFHYDTISAFIKSIRGSDPDAAVYWLARMIDAGEDPLFIARRMVILASEDVGNADPLAMVVAACAFQSVHAVGMPEAQLILAQATTYLASAPKSNASTEAIVAALEDARTTGHEAVPLHLRNAPTSLMKAMGHGSGYKYAHDFEGGFVDQEFLPKKLKDRVYYRPKDIGIETRIKERLEKWWPKKKRQPPSNLKNSQTT